MATHADLPRPDSLTLGNNTPEERRRAARTTADHARDAADCRDLLDKLGLLPATRVRTHGMPGYRAGCRCKRCRHANAERNRRQRANRTRTYLTEQQWQERKNGAAS